MNMGVLPAYMSVPHMNLVSMETRKIALYAKCGPSCWIRKILCLVTSEFLSFTKLKDNFCKCTNMLGTKQLCGIIIMEMHLLNDLYSRNSCLMKRSSHGRWFQDLNQTWWYMSVSFLLRRVEQVGCSQEVGGEGKERERHPPC